MALPHEPRSPLRLGVLISGGGSTLANLINRIADGRLPNVVIRMVISSRAAVGGVAIARQAGLPVEVIRRRDFPEEGGFSAAIAAALDRAGVDLVVMAGFLCFWRIPPHFEGRVLNIHPALLPAFGGRGMYGLRVHEAVRAAGATVTGCTVHLADNEYDHGPIIAARQLEIQPGEDAATLARRVGELERELYPEIIARVAEHGVGWLRTVAASPELPSGLAVQPAQRGPVR